MSDTGAGDGGAIGWSRLQSARGASTDASSGASSGADSVSRFPPAERRGRALLSVAKAFAALFLLGCVSLVGGFFLFIASLNSYDNASPAQADGIVALTGGAHRITDAIDLLSRGHGERLLISGVNERTTREEIARLNPGQRRLLECCVDLDYRARNTIGNAIETRRWIADHGFGSVIVVTSNYHMPRTMLELRNAVPEVEKFSFAVVPSSIDTTNWWRDGTALRLLGLEYLKFIAAWGRTLVETDPEVSRAAALLSRSEGPVNADMPKGNR